VNEMEHYLNRMMEEMTIKMKFRTILAFPTIPSTKELLERIKEDLNVKTINLIKVDFCNLEYFRDGKYVIEIKGVIYLEEGE